MSAKEQGVDAEVPRNGKTAENCLGSAVSTSREQLPCDFEDPNFLWGRGFSFRTSKIISKCSWDFRSDDRMLLDRSPTSNVGDNVPRFLRKFHNRFFFSENYREAADGRNSAPPGMHETL